jgi:hypothetical protein
MESGILNFSLYALKLSGEKFSLPCLQQSRERSSSASTERSARLAIRRRRIYGAKRRLAGFARRQTRVFSRDCEKSAGFGNGGVADRKMWGISTVEFFSFP